jgi:hypothetical protein
VAVVVVMGVALTEGGESEEIDVVDEAESLLA